MKAFYAMLLLAIAVTVLWINSGLWGFDREMYLSKKVLELSVPFNVKINVEFLQSLQPANESSGTSTKGI